MRDLDYKHFFHVTDGKFVWEDPKMFEFKKRNLEGKRGYAIIEEEPLKSSPNQLAYYFGGIIRKECMQSNCFAGWTEKEIHSYLLMMLRGTVRQVIHKDGSRSMSELPADFERIHNNKVEMSKYIEEVIAFLNSELDIHPKPASHYKYNRFRMDIKHY